MTRKRCRENEEQEEEQERWREMCGKKRKDKNGEKGDGDKEELEAKTKKVREDSRQEHRQAMEKKSEYVRRVEGETGVVRRRRV